jgi:transposase
METLFGAESATESAPRSASLRIRKPAIEPDQAELLRPALADCVPADSPARWILRASLGLELSDFIKPSQGGASYDPRRLLAVWFLALHDGLSSSRQIERFCRSDWQYQYLTQGHCPDHATLCRFRRSLGELMPRLLAQTVRLAREQGLASFKVVALDGTRLPGNVSQWGRALSRVRVESEEAEPPPSDPDCRTMRGPHGFVVGYNAQAAVDSQTGMVAMGYVTNAGVDQEQMGPAVEALSQTCGPPEALAADGGYATVASAEILSKSGVNGYMPPNISTAWRIDEHGQIRCRCNSSSLGLRRGVRKGKRVLQRKCLVCGSSFCHPEGVDPRGWLELNARAGSAEMVAMASMRRSRIEPLFNLTKNRYGLRRFTLRSLPLVNIQWLMVLTLRNLTLIEGPRASNPRSLRLFKAPCWPQDAQEQAQAA